MSVVVKAEPGEEGDVVQAKILALCESMPEVRERGQSPNLQTFDESRNRFRQPM